VKKKCFVVMGFGKKTDFRTQRTLDLDKTFKYIIKPAVDAAGLECVRADEIVHSGTIDKPMYEHLLDADVVVADLSTSNENAIYELGVRHALKPHTTIVIAEDRFKFPFDINHILIRPYRHDGEALDVEVVEAFKPALTRAIQELVAKPAQDSPVYDFLDIEPPAQKGAGGRAVLASTFAMAAATRGFSLESSVRMEEAPPSLRALDEAFLAARKAGNWEVALGCLNALLAKRGGDPFLIQQKALATYKSRKPDAITALANAKAVLEALAPEQTRDAETLGLWGAIHKRIFELGREKEALDVALRAYERGFQLRADPYNGINYAFLLDVRGQATVDTDRAESVADYVLARRVRRQIIATMAQQAEKGVKQEDGKLDEEETFWLRATLAEAHLGVGDRAAADAMRVLALTTAREDWMITSMNDQWARLEGLLAVDPSRELGAR
jgi:tetratricopeptide (TPR) repeat protein